MQQRPDSGVTALDLGPDAEPTPEIAAYFAQCREKLGFVLLQYVQQDRVRDRHGAEPGVSLSRSSEGHLIT